MSKMQTPQSRSDGGKCAVTNLVDARFHAVDDDDDGGDSGESWFEFTFI